MTIAAIKDAIDKTLEEAARIAYDMEWSVDYEGGSWIAAQIARDIRALRQNQPRDDS